MNTVIIGFSRGVYAVSFVDSTGRVVFDKDYNPNKSVGYYLNGIRATEQDVMQNDVAGWTQSNSLPETN